MPSCSSAMRLQVCSEKRDIDVLGWIKRQPSQSGLRDTFGINHLLTSNTATAQQNVMANAELGIRVRMIGFLHLCPALGILDVR
jgi:hypothetical protein